VLDFCIIKYNDFEKSYIILIFIIVVTASETHILQYVNLTDVSVNKMQIDIFFNGLGKLAETMGVMRRRLRVPRHFL